MKKNKKVILFIFLTLVLLTVFSSSRTVGAEMYKNQEKIPGASGQTDCLPDYIKQIIGFGFAVIGIMAMFMLCIGAYQYLMAAGNIGKVENAKETIASALLGLALGLTAWIILAKINPDLVSMTLDCSGSAAGTPGGSTGGNPGNSGGNTGGNNTPNTGNNGSGKCEPVTAGPCSVSELSKNSCWSSSGADLSKISSLCNAESGGKEVMSTVDKCSDGTPFSCGGLQVNMTCTCKGKGAFSGPEPKNGCANKKCTGAGAGYQACVDATCYGQGNLNAACQLYKERKGNPYNTWSKNKECGF
jgi:hypothetical protein